MDPTYCAKNTLLRVAAMLEQVNRDSPSSDSTSKTIQECINGIDLAIALIDHDFEVAWRLEREANEKQRLTLPKAEPTAEPKPQVSPSLARLLHYLGNGPEVQPQPEKEDPNLFS